MFFLGVEQDFCNSNILSEKCLKFILKSKNCKENAWKFYVDLSFSDLDELKGYVAKSYKDSSFNSYDENGNLFRVMCYGITTLNDYNVLLRAKVTTNPEPSDFRYASSLITDGVRLSKLKHGGCFQQDNGDKTVTIDVEKPKIIRKIIIYSTIIENKQISLRIIQDDNTTNYCDSKEINIKNKKTEVFCSSPKLKRFKKIAIESSNSLHICEVEGYNGIFFIFIFFFLFK